VPLIGLTNYGNGSDSIVPGNGSPGNRANNNTCNGMDTRNSIHARGAGDGSGARGGVCNSRKSVRDRDGYLFEIQKRNELNLPVERWMMKLLAGQSFPRNQPELHLLGFRSIKPQPLV
jgi:hypothetical protein